ncbi:zinc-ribbon domain-containing protein [Chryseobacterium sp. GP-SGM7]|uniref:zinc-ribbon domain-containing protein n=1 Tax=Chryseobacterium sp. GP-SGM7 TaxID=3411323 RepID=UPI003B963A35
MFFLFGTGKSTLKNQYPLTNCECPICHQTNTMVAGTVAKYAHFFFIPVIPTSKKNIAVCTNCNSNFVLENKQFTPQMEQSFDSQQRVNPNPRPIWHGCGCFIIFLGIIFLLGTAVVGWFRSKDEPEKPEDKRKVLLKSDLSKATRKPEMKIDSTSFYLKECMDMLLGDTVNQDEIEYFSKSNGNKLLVLVDIDDMKKIESSSRYHIIEYVKECLKMHEGYADKEFYIGIDGRWNMILVSTPNGSDTSGKHADEELLYPFYNKTENVIQEVEIKIKKDADSAKDK